MNFQNSINSAEESKSNKVVLGECPNGDKDCDTRSRETMCELCIEQSPECAYGYENCSEDDAESMCDEHRAERAEQHHEGMMDTYD